MWAPHRQLIEKTQATIGALGRLPFGAFRYSGAGFLLALILLMVATPYVEDLPRGDLVEAGLLTVVLGSGVLAIGGRRGRLLFGLALALPAISCKWFNHLRPDLLPPAWHLAFGLAFCVFLIAELMRYTVQARRVDLDVLCAGLAVYLMIGLVWTFAYILLARVNPQAFAFTSGSDPKAQLDVVSALYFSLITLSTVGYGDIVPVSRTARLLATSEALTGLIFMGVMLARLVTLYLNDRDRDAEGAA